jgi:hypothetical protein
MIVHPAAPVFRRPELMEARASFQERRWVMKDYNTLGGSHKLLVQKVPELYA